MNRVEIHKYDAERMRSRLEFRLKDFEEDLEDVKIYYRILETLGENTALFASVGEKVGFFTVAERLSFLRMSKEAHFHYAQLLSQPEKSFIVSLGGRVKAELKAEESERYRYESYFKWNMAFYMALILRDKETLKELYSMDMSRAGSVNEKDHLVIDLLKFQYFYYAGRNHERTEQLFHEMTTIVKRHFAGTFYLPDVDEWPYPNYFLSYNPVLILKAIEEGNQEEFSRNLLEGLEFHQTYWGRSYGLNAGDAPLHDDPRGLISWPLTALAALAYDRGMKIEVESEYIPRYMIENRWE